MIRRFILAGALAALLAASVASRAEAVLSITVPASANLGSTSVSSSSMSAQLGTVTASGNLLTLAFTATVSTTVFTTGGGTPNETIAKTQISYWSGPSSATSGVLLTNVPGQANAGLAVPLTTPAVAYTASGAAAFSVSWNPTIVIQIPSSAVAGTYTGTITHSVA